MQRNCDLHGFFMISAQFQFPQLKKTLKLSINQRTYLKQLLPLFSAKLDIDFSLYKITAKTRSKPRPIEIMLDLPIISLLKDIKIKVQYEGG